MEAAAAGADAQAPVNGLKKPTRKALNLAWKVVTLDPSIAVVHFEHNSANIAASYRTLLAETAKGMGDFGLFYRGIGTRRQRTGTTGMESLLNTIGQLP